MGIHGYQDYWRTGSRLFMTLDPFADNQMIDLGTIDTANPTIETNEVKLQDGDLGLLKTVDKEITSFVESYEIALKNCSLDNLRLLFYGSDLQSWSQAATIRQIGMTAGMGRLLKMRSAYSSPYEFVNDVQEMMALGICHNYSITAVTSTTFTVTLQTGVAGSARFAAGDKIRVFGNATTGANVEYTIISVSGTGAATILTVASTNSATVSGKVGLVAPTLSNIMAQPIASTGGTLGPPGTLIVAGDWTLEYPVGARFHLWGQTTTGAPNNSAPASADPASTSTGVNTYIVGAVAFSSGFTTITLDATTPLAAAPTVSGQIARAARLGYDWEVVDLVRATIRVRADATNVVASQPVCPIFLPRAIAASMRLIYPQARSGGFSGTFLLEWGRGNGAQRTVREFTGVLTPSSSNFQVTDYSSFNCKIEVTSDITKPTTPAGRLLNYKGSVPDLS
jgi:hypothetical protein